MAYNISAFAGAGAQFFDSNGVPLVGGLLYVYTAGTTTPATTWTTNSGAVANTNPIVLNAAGRTPYEIWLNSGVTYKFALYTSTSVLIGTYDNIPAIDDPTAFNNLIAVTGTNTLVGSSTPPYTAYVAGMTLSFIPVNTNTGAVTLDVDGLGAKNIYAGSSTPLIGSELVAGRIVQIEYDGVRFQLYQSSVSIPDGAVTTAKLADGAVTTVKLADGAATGAKLGSDVIQTTGTQTIGGAKTFTSPVTFNDTTQQNTAFVGGRAQVFTSSGTFTVPTGVSAAKITVVGGGGGGGSKTGSGTYGGCGGGGGGGVAVLYTTGLTPGASVSVTVGSGGAAATAGGTSSFGAFCSATGGAAGANSTSSGVNGDGGAGGAGSSGTINISGGPGGKGNSTASCCSAAAVGGSGGGAGAGDSTARRTSLIYVFAATYGQFGFSGGAGASQAFVSSAAKNGEAATGYGNGGSGACYGNGNPCTGGAGSGGIVIVEW